MKQVFKKQICRDYFFMIAGTGMMALAIQCIYDPAGLVVGGFTGIAIIVKELSALKIPGGVPLWLTNAALNIPVFLFGWKIMGKKFVGRTAAATLMMSLWLYVIPAIRLTEGDLMLSAVYGGALSGIGLGLVLLAKSTTGGTDMVASLIQHYVRHYSVVQIMLVLDGIIVIIGAAVFGVTPALYAVVAIYLTTKVSDGLLDGFKYSKAVFIISNQPQIIADSILQELGRGVTGITSKGMYSGDDKNMLYCVVSKKELVELKDIVNRLDEQAFVIVTDAREVLGEGFLEY